MRFDGNEAARPGNRRVVGRRVVQVEAEKISQRERISRPPALGVDAFEIADQQQPEVDARWQARPAHRVGIKPGTLRFDEIIEAMLAQQLIQPSIKRMTRACRQVGRRHPHRRLSAAFSFAHRHGRSVVRDFSVVDRRPRRVCVEPVMTGEPLIARSFLSGCPCDADTHHHNDHESDEPLQVKQPNVKRHEWEADPNENDGGHDAGEDR
jgi:hypothetical protein